GVFYFGMVNEEKIQENKLRILGRLSAGLIHEIRNPLSVINLNLDYIKMNREELNPELNDCVDACLESSERIQNLIETFLDFSRKTNTIEDFISVNEVSDRAIDIMLPALRKANISIEKIYLENHSKVKFHPIKMLQVFINLLSNAIEAIESNGKIIVKIFSKSGKEGENFYWEIEDNGSGIEDCNREKIFDDFYTNKEKGTGFGLSVCKMLLDEYKSTLSFESEFGKGTKFTIKFRS
ncbi:MAG TPA: HAMP domain-containing sensor histidine kinase, partial [Ignavibacteriaceae bacterium]|nr:HAMP domain-containing sensor histidine kinase [Ignavibacteriaceae bacterium]